MLRECWQTLQTTKKLQTTWTKELRMTFEETSRRMKPEWFDNDNNDKLLFHFTNTNYILYFEISSVHN